jgi:REP element-mobilizing transposase RayT
MRPIRNRDPEVFRLITIRTCEARLWISLTSNVRKLIGGIIARYQEIFGIELFAYNVLGNHMHLLVRAPGSNIDEFCENVNREIAKRINWRNKREGKFWGRRYDDQQVLSEDDLVEAFLYVTTNPTKHGLVSNSQDWPGLNSYEHCLTEKDRHFSFNHYSEERRVTKHKLKLSVLPAFKKLSKGKRIALIKRLLVERTNEIAERARQGLSWPTGSSGSSPGRNARKVSKSPVRGVIPNARS